MKKVELSEDQAPDTTTEDSSTSLAPTILYLTTFETAPATEESLILPVTALWPQVRGLRTALELEESLRPHREAQGWEGISRGRGGWLETKCLDAHQLSYSPVGTPPRKDCHHPGEGGPGGSL